MAAPVHSLHILGSREFGGADQFYVRLLSALHATGSPVTAINRPGSPVADALAKGPVHQLHLPLANRWDAWSWWQIRKQIRKTAPCVVQSYMGRATRLTSVPKGTNAALIARLGGFYKIDGYYRHADAWVGNTKAICDYLIKSGMPSDRVHHIGNFVPEPVPVGVEKLEALRSSYKIPKDAWVIFSLGRFVRKKGFSELLEAISLLPNEVAGRPVVLLLAGDGPMNEELNAQIRDLKIEPRVRLIGWQNPPDAFYQMADAFVCPSNHEPLGNVILEAWNHFVPVISTRNEGATELIEEGRTGLLCNCRDPKGMASVILQMLESSLIDRNKMASQGNTCLNQNYGRQAIVEQYNSLYSHTLAKKFPTV